MLDGLDGMDWLSYTDVTPRASLQSDANNIDSISFLDNSYGFNNLWLLLHVVQVTFFTILSPRRPSPLCECNDGQKQGEPR